MDQAPDWTLRSATDIAGSVRAGRVNAEQIAVAALERIATRQALEAWVHIDHARVLSNARAMDAAGVRDLPLAGVPIGVKDLMNTFDQPTAYGSIIYAGHRPAADAAIVARLRAAGALIMGKTVTTEFAYRQPGPTVNPHHAGHTPGGSSSGSAAAVADFHVPVATATQTSGSVIRPAAFCGVVGFKPTYGELPSMGVKACAESLDTVGLIARSVTDIVTVRSALVNEVFTRASGAFPLAPRIGVCRTAMASQAEPAAITLLDATANRLRQAGAQLTDIELPDGCESLWQDQQTILLFELARNFADEFRRHHGQLSRHMRDAIVAGLAVELHAYRNAQANAETSRVAVDALFGSYDFLLTLASPGEAPADLTFTGDPVFNSAWTLLHVPCLTLPAGTGPRGLPLGVQLIGARRQDESLLRWALWSEERLIVP